MPSTTTMKTTRKTTSKRWPDHPGPDAIRDISGYHPDKKFPRWLLCQSSAVARHSMRQLLLLHASFSSIAKTTYNDTCILILRRIDGMFLDIVRIVFLVFGWFSFVKNMKAEQRIAFLLKNSLGEVVYISDFSLRTLIFRIKYKWIFVFS